MTTPILLGQRVFNSASFTSTIDSTSDPIDFGSNTGRWVQVMLYTDNNGVNLNTVTVGGNSLIAETQIATPTGGAGNGRAFRLQGDSVPTGISTITGTSSSSSGRLQMIISWGHTASGILPAAYTGPGGVSPTFTATSTTNDLVGVHGVTSANTVAGGNAWTAPYVQFIAASGSTLGDIQIPNAGQLHAWALNETGGESSTVLGLTISDNQYTPASAGWTFVVNGTISAPTVSTQPSNSTVTEGATSTFTAAFTNTPTSFAWEFADSPYSSWSAVVGGTGATTAAYTTAATTLSITGRRYRCTATNAGGSVTTNGVAELTVNPTLTAPSITVQPSSQSATVASTATFSATATGTGSLTAQWRKNGTNVGSAVAITTGVSFSYTTPTLVNGDNGAVYSVVVTGNTAPPATSINATLTVTPPVIPQFPGALNLTLLTTSSYTLGWTAATDDVGVTGYELSLNGGSTWTDIGLVLSTNVSSRTPGTTDACRVRAYDGAGNRSLALARSVTLSLTQVVTEPLENDAGSLFLNTPVKWSWFPGGRLGAMENITPLDGTGTTHATIGNILIEGLPLGPGVLMTCIWGATADLDSVHYQYLTVI